jgi:ER membrane protein complex subunit 1
MFIAQHTYYAHALFEDQVGEFDWNHKYLGKSKHVLFGPDRHSVCDSLFISLCSRSLSVSLYPALCVPNPTPRLSLSRALPSPPLSSTTTQLFVTSESSTVARINARNGNIVWRQVLPKSDHINALGVSKKSVATVSNNCVLVRVWYTHDGGMIWASDSVKSSSSLHETTLSGELRTQHDNHVQRFHRDRTMCQATFANDGASLVIVNGYTRTVTSYSSNDGDIQWVYELPIVPRRAQLANGVSNRMYVSGVAKSSIGDITLNLNTGKEVDKSTVPTTVINPTGAFFAGLNTEAERTVMSFEQTDHRLFLKIYDPVMGSISKSIADLISTIEPGFTLGRSSHDSLITRETLDFGCFTVSANDKVYLLRVDAGALEVDAIASGPARFTKFQCAAVSDGEGYIYHATLGSPNQLHKATVRHAKWGKSSTALSLSWQTQQVDLLTAAELKSIHTHRVSKKGSSEPTHQILLLSSDATMWMIAAGKMRWYRDEGLGEIVSAQHIDRPAALWDGMGEDDEPRFPSVFERIVSQVDLVLTPAKSMLNFVFSRLLAQPAPFHVPRSSEVFGFNRIIVAVSRNGRVYGIDAETGNPEWATTIRFATKETFGKLSVAQYVSADIYHLDGHTAVLLLTPLSSLNDQENAAGIVRRNAAPFKVVINISTGAVIKNERLDFRVLHAAVLPIHYGAHRHILMIVGDTKLSTVRIYPDTDESRKAFTEYSSQVHFWTASVSENMVTGYTLGPVTDEVREQLRPTLLPLCARISWRMSFADRVEMISAIAARGANEAVQSTVYTVPGPEPQKLHKYLNPNVIAVVTHRASPSAVASSLAPLRPTTNAARSASSDPSVVLYIIDTVSGVVIERIAQSNAQGPVNAVMTENMIVYSFFNKKAQQFEVSSVEMTWKERATHLASGSSDDGTFSSWDNSHKHIQVRQQTYALKHGIANLAVSSTKHGISSKMFLFGLTSGQVLGLPQVLLSPHRPHVADPTVKPKQMTLPPYQADLPDAPEMMLTHMSPVMNLKTISTYHSNLESTSLVFAYGLDMFHVRVMPSNAFDLLNDDFNVPLLIATVTGMLIGVIVTWRLAKNKSLREQWA